MDMSWLIQRGYGSIGTFEASPLLNKNPGPKSGLFCRGVHYENGSTLWHICKITAEMATDTEPYQKSSHTAVFTQLIH
jgi:hypothetical protein